MPGLALRDFECILCRRQFTLLSQDLVLPWTLICDECLAEIWGLEGNALETIRDRELEREGFGQVLGDDAS